MEKSHPTEAIFRVDSVEVEKAKYPGYSYTVTYDKNPLSFTLANQIICWPSPDGQVYVRSTSGTKKGKDHTLVEIWQDRNQPRQLQEAFR